MEVREERVHTTLNLSKRLIREAESLFKDKTKTEIIHEALGEAIRKEKFARHIHQWAGKGKICLHG